MLPPMLLIIDPNLIMGVGKIDERMLTSEEQIALDDLSRAGRQLTTS